MQGIRQSDVLKILAKGYRQQGLTLTANKMEDEAAVYEAAEIITESERAKDGKK